MEQEHTGGISADVVVVGLAVAVMTVFTCSMNHIPQTLYRVARSWIQSLCGFNRATTGQNANQEPPHPPNNDINEITMLESMDDVHLFLEELRLSAMTRPNLNISNLTRYEFITNLLITEKVEATTCHDQSMSCAICLGDYQLGDITCSSHNAKCNHQFHQICIYRWLLQNRDDCPCCRNNYLALSDDNDSTPTPDPSPSSSTDITSDVDNVTENSPSTNTVEEMAWIPSYLAPFPPPRPTVESEEVENEQSVGPIAPASSSLDLPSTSERQVESLTVASGGNHDDGSQTDDLDQLDDAEVWSCPSVDDLDQELGNNRHNVMRNKSWIPNRSTMIRRSVVSQRRYSANDEQTQSLQLDALIVEALMQRLQARSSVHNNIRPCSPSSSSSSSVYTEGSTDLELNMPQRSIVVGNVAREESEMCAICGAVYAVNEELCWSQDPLCTHVFHRSCMQQWIREGHDFCPFCRAHDNNANQQQQQEQQPNSTDTATGDTTERLPNDPMVSSFVEAARGDEISSECPEGSGMVSSEGLETSCLDSDLDILADV